MKRAKLEPCAYDAFCPYCGEAMAEPDSGSLMWDLANISTVGRVVECIACGEHVNVALPKARQRKSCKLAHPGTLIRPGWREGVHSDTRTMGQLTAAEQDKVIAEAIRKLKAEMENNAALEAALRDPITIR